MTRSPILFTKKFVGESWFEDLGWAIDGPNRFSGAEMGSPSFFSAVPFTEQRREASEIDSG